MTQIKNIGLFTSGGDSPGMNAAKIRGGIEHSLEQLKAQGYDVSQIYVSTDAAKLEALVEHLASEPVDVVTIGGGVTRPVKNAELLEAFLKRSKTQRTESAHCFRVEGSYRSVNRWPIFSFLVFR